MNDNTCPRLIITVTRCHRSNSSYGTYQVKSFLQGQPPHEERVSIDGLNVLMQRTEVLQYIDTITTRYASIGMPYDIIYLEQTLQEKPVLKFDFWKGVA